MTTAPNSHLPILLSAALIVLAACTGLSPRGTDRMADAGNVACMTAARAVTFHSLGGRSGVPAAGASALSCGSAAGGQASITASAPEASGPVP